MPSFVELVRAYLKENKHNRKTFKKNYGISVNDFIEKLFHTNIIDFYNLN